MNFMKNFSKLLCLAALLTSCTTAIESVNGATSEEAGGVWIASWEPDKDNIESGNFYLRSDLAGAVCGLVSATEKKGEKIPEFYKVRVSVKK
jgi:hypothetical protein